MTLPLLHAILAAFWAQRSADVFQFARFPLLVSPFQNFTKASWSDSNIGWLWLFILFVVGVLPLFHFIFARTKFKEDTNWLPPAAGKVQRNIAWKKSSYFSCENYFYFYSKKLWKWREKKRNETKRNERRKRKKEGKEKKKEIKLNWKDQSYLPRG